MNPLLKKEIRLLLPAWLAVIALGAIVPWFWFWDSADSAVCGGPFLFFFGIVLLSVNTFGRESALRSFQTLLSQPIERSLIWRTKVGVLLLASLLVFAVYFISCKIMILQVPYGQSVWRVNLPIIQDDFHKSIIANGIGMFVAIVGGLWMALLLRQIAAAFWFAFLIPAALLALIALVMSKFFPSAPDTVVFGVLYGVAVTYIVSVYWQAYRLFLQAQDVAWTGGEIVMPEIPWLSRLLGRPAHPRAALWRKEFQLQQAQFIIALVLGILQLVDLAIRKLGHYRQNSDTEFILESFWFLWMVLPCLAGCAAMAEERKLGTHESQLCLPVKRRTQFAIKLSVVVLLSILFGAVMPLLFEGDRILPGTHDVLVSMARSMANAYSAPQNFLAVCLESLASIYPLFLLAGLATGIGIVSFFVSTQTRNTLQALAPATIYLVFFGFCMVAAVRPGFSYHPIWAGYLIYFIGIPIALLTLLALAYRNFRHVSLGGKTWLANLLVVAASLVLAAAMTIAIYHRAWEKLTPFEPPHGPARLAMSDPITLSQQGDVPFIRLPDGKVWTSSWSWMDPTPASLLFNNSRIQPQPGDFFPGSGWKMAGRMYGELVGIKEDGTLWISEKPSPIGKKTDRSYQENENAMRHLVQVGTETDWSEFLSINQYCILLTKRDGTLWRWGQISFDIDHKQWPGLIAFTPEQEGTGSNWAGFVHSTYTGFLRKKDGTFWTEDNLLIPKAPPLRNPTIAGLLGLWQIGINENGILCMWAEQHSVNRSLRRGYSEWIGTGWPIGSGSNWVAVASSDWNVVTLKDDGTLWFWDFSHIFNQVRTDENMENTVPVRLGIHSDWIAVTSRNGYVLSLAADGSLWYWPMEDRWPGSYYYGDDDHRFEPLLDISRKPQLLGNVFSTNSITR